MCLTALKGLNEFIKEMLRAAIEKQDEMEHQYSMYHGSEYYEAFVAGALWAKKYLSKKGT